MCPCRCVWNQLVVARCGPFAPSTVDFETLCRPVRHALPPKRFAHHSRQHLVPALARFDVAVQVSASLMIISCYVFRQWAAAVESGKPLSPLAASLILAVVPYLSHNSAYVRGFAAWGFFHIVNSVDDPEASHVRIPALLFRRISATLDLVHRLLVSSVLCFYISSLGNFSRVHRFCNRFVFSLRLLFFTHARYMKMCLT